MTRRNPAQDQVAIVGLGRSPYTRATKECTPGSLVIDAALDAIRDAGLAAGDIDGICGTSVAAQYVQGALGIPEVSWFANPPAVFGNQIVAAVGAVHSGMCETALIYHSTYRSPFQSRSAAQDPIRRRLATGGRGMAGWMGTGHVDVGPNSLVLTPAYAALAGKYLHDYGYTRDVLAKVAINSRTGARDNANAVYREPMTIDDYYAARMVRAPLGLFDMDVPVDSGDAFVVTTTERARDLPHRPVLIHSATLGITDYASEEQLRDFEHTGQSVVADRLWSKSSVERGDVDVFMAYDGFSNIPLLWFENLGWCGRGEGGSYIDEHWDSAAQRILIGGSIPVNPHGGSLSEGGTQGSGHTYEACLQLRGQAGPRQVDGADVVLMGLGGFFFNSQGVILRGD